MVEDHDDIRGVGWNGIAEAPIRALLRHGNAGRGGPVAVVVSVMNIYIGCAGQAASVRIVKDRHALTRHGRRGLRPYCALGRITITNQGAVVGVIDQGAGCIGEVDLE